MVDPSKPLVPAKVKDYYKSEYSAASNSYFSQSGTLQGQWHGQLAADFGLTGPVGAQAFDRLADGEDPRSGNQLIRHRETHLTREGKEVAHRAAWDLTFNAPKTVSLTALVGEDERVREAHREAVVKTLDYLERYTQARTGGNAPAQTTGRWATATFEHDTARPVDGYPAPHIHTHAIVFNMTTDGEGNHRSLQPYEFFRAQAMATAIYQSELGHNLRALGYEVTRGTNHAADIAGYTPEYLATESLRHARLKQRLEELGIGGRRAEDIINHQNREDKLAMSAEELRKLHKANAELWGNQPARVVEQASSKIAPPQLADEQRLQMTGEAVRSAVRKLNERTAVIEEHRIITQALRYGQGHILLNDVEQELQRQRASRELISVDHVRPHAPGHRYTTPAMIRMERSVLSRVLEGQNSATPIADDPDFGRYEILKANERRQAVLRALLTTRDQIVGLQGGAGTGKTTALEIVKEIAEQNGFEVRGLAPTSRARNELAARGIQSATLQKHLLTSAKQETAPAQRLYFVDESSLSSTNQMHQFLKKIRADDRVILVGDVRQHQSVEAGRIFGELQDAGMKTAQLNKVVRQKDADLKRSVILMANGKVAEGVEELRKQGRVHETAKRQDRFTAIANAYLDSPENTLVVSPDNLSRQEINTSIREQRQQRGELKDERTVPVLIRKDLDAEDRKRADSYRVSDAIRFHANIPTLKIKAGVLATVLDTQPAENTISVQIRQRDGQLRNLTFNPQLRSALSVYEPQERSFASGDRIQFTTPWSQKGVASRDTAVIEQMESNGNISVRLDNNRRVAWNLKEFNHLDYAYAMTSHSSQGMTVDRVLIHVDTGDSRVRGLVDKTLSYVATSRARNDAQIFTDNAAELSRALSRHNVKETALSPAQIELHRTPARMNTTARYGVG